MSRLTSFKTHIGEATTWLPSKAYGKIHLTYGSITAIRCIDLATVIDDNPKFLEELLCLDSIV